MSAYRLVPTRGTAEALHLLADPDPMVPTIWWHSVSRPALVLGSTQGDSIVDVEAARSHGIDVVRRRSGGGAVLLLPGEFTWLDVIVPSQSHHWVADVHAQMVWIGHRIVRAVEAVTEGRRLSVHQGGLVSTPWSRTVCFDGIGPGEVLLDGLKLVGISQRRTRRLARLQLCWYSRYEPADLVPLLLADHRPPPADLSPVATLDAGTSALVAGALGEDLGDDG